MCGDSSLSARSTDQNSRVWLPSSAGAEDRALDLRTAVEDVVGRGHAPAAVVGRGERDDGRGWEHLVVVDVRRGHRRREVGRGPHVERRALRGLLVARLVHRPVLDVVRHVTGRRRGDRDRGRVGLLCPAVEYVVRGGHAGACGPVAAGVGGGQVELRGADEVVAARVRDLGDGRDRGGHVDRERRYVMGLRVGRARQVDRPVLERVQAGEHHVDGRGRRGPVAWRHRRACSRCRPPPCRPGCRPRRVGW